jgi:hypothetical protein
MNDGRISFPESKNWGYEMSDKTQNRGGLETRIHYENTVEGLDLSELWQRYIAELAYELFRTRYGNGGRFYTERAYYRKRSAGSAQGCWR